MLQVHTRFTRTCLIRSNIASDVVFLEVLGLVVILYSISIKYFLNSWPINYFPWSYVVSIGLGYLDVHLVSTKFATGIALLLFCALLQRILLQDLSRKRILDLNFLFITLYVWRGSKLDLHRVYTMVFTKLP